MHKLLLAMITVTAMAFSGCGSGDASCSEKGKCSQETAPTAADISSCQLRWPRLAEASTSNTELHVFE